MVKTMELQGVVLAGVVLVFVFYVLPYVYRHRHFLSQTPLDDGHSQDLRILNLGDTQTPTSDNSGESHDGVLANRHRALKSRPVQKAEPKEKNDVRSLARERARRRARIAKREANRTRGFALAIVFGVLVVGLWIGSLVFSLPIVFSIIVSVLCAAYSGGFVYLLGQMNRANEADLDAIERVDTQLKALRRSASQLAYERARKRAGRGSVNSVRDVQTYSSDYRKLRVEAPSVSERAATSRVTTSVKSANSVSQSTASRLSTRSAHDFTYRALSTVPSYTLKRQQVAQRDVSPYVPPEMPESKVPYRPTKLGERLDISSLDIASVKRKVSRDDSVAPKKQSLAGGAVLDDMLARRRA
ncbi:MAG: hypothetical protein IKZ87_02740 [Actinomycetaceae bacterium]|nr:hypothetical protein [Actinomycetaceae bacterium]